MRHRLLGALVAALALAGCGAPSTSHPPAASGRRAQSAPMPAAVPAPCRASDYSMPCALGPAPLRLSATPSPSALAYGVDFGWGGPDAAAMRAHGWRFGASYLSNDASKDWQPGQAASYARAGIARVFVGETLADRALAGCAAGAGDARADWAKGQALGIRVLYLAVDFDETPAQAPLVAAYFRCAGRIVGISHLGAYGGYWTVKRLLDAHLVAYAWQTYAWSGGLWDPRAKLEQYQNASTIDYDRAIAADYGQTPAPAPAPARIHCFGRRYDPRSHARVCDSLRPQVSRWSHARDASGRVLRSSEATLAADRCRRPYRRAVCVGAARAQRTMRQRERWFAAHVHRALRAYG